jgi:DNA repair protein RecO (recombination protein O)
MAERTRQESREAFILHGYAYRETSLLIEAFTRPFGRVSMVARGARSPRSPLRGVLLAFQPLALSWFGKGELRTLARAEWIGGQPLLHGEALLCGFYLNELLLRLVPREDPHDALFSRYWETLQRLVSHGGSAAALRSFERALLKELGYAMTLERDSASGGAIDPAKSYTYDPERGPIEVKDAGPGPRVSGRTLLDMARDDYADPQTQQQAKALMRTLINHRLDYQPLKSRQIFRDLLAL